MEKVKLEIVGLSYSQTQSGAYALVLAETGGKRSLPIIIGGFEAQAIAIELEKMTPTRPLTHDLFKSFAQSFQIEVVEVIIYNLVEGVFYAKLICSKDEKISEIDARTSDAIALALRFSAPIFTYKNILDKAGIHLNNPTELENQNLDDGGSLSTPETFGLDSEGNTSKDIYKSMSLSELHEALEKAVQNEDYEKAAKIRDEISKRES